MNWCLLRHDIFYMKGFNKHFKPLLLDWTTFIFVTDYYNVWCEKYLWITDEAIIMKKPSRLLGVWKY